MVNHRQQILRGAEELRRLYGRIKSEFAHKPHGMSHHQACREFHEKYDGLAFPGGWNAGLKALKNGDGDAAKTAIQFLEADEIFHRSGYMKEDILRHLKPIDLSRSLKQILIECTVRSIHSGGRREAKQYARLTSTYGDKTLREYAEKTQRNGNSPEAQRRAIYLLKLIMNSGKGES